MENNNGRGIFYGVIGVATLVVAMIGATFAYFSASAGTEGTPIALNSTTITLSLEQNTAGIKYNLIPVKEDTAGWAQGGYIGNSTVKTPRSANCVDDGGNEFCSVYEVTVKNPSTTTAQTIYAKMDVATNSFSVNTRDAGSSEGEPTCSKLTVSGESAVYCDKTNVAFAIFKGRVSEISNWSVSNATSTYYSKSGGAATNGSTSIPTSTADTATGLIIADGTAVLGKAGDLVVARMASDKVESQAVSYNLDALTQTLRPEGEATYTIVMWLHDNNQDQEADEGQAFAAGLTFSTSSNGGGGVTAVLATTQASQN